LALIPFLRKALRDALDNDIPQPWGEQYPDLYTFHQAAMAFFQADHQHYAKMIQKYADLMNGDAPDSKHEPQLIAGPWVDKQDS